MIIQGTSIVGVRCEVADPFLTRETRNSEKDLIYDILGYMFLSLSYANRIKTELLSQKLSSIFC